MADPVWGMLSKALDNAQTIDEAITAGIEAHEADSNAHQGAGESLETHRAQDIIDHPAGSVVMDKFPNKRIIVSSFESLDGWEKAGNYTIKVGGLTIYTTAVANNKSVVYAIPGGWVGLDWDRNFFWKTVARLNASTSQTVYIGVGGSDYVGGYSGAGFKISNGTLYAYHAFLDGGSFNYTTFEITGVTVTDAHVYAIEYDVVEGTLEFFVDGVSKKVWSSGLPTTDTDELALYQIETTTTSARYLYVSDMVYQTDQS